jgi:hypothetical protein
MPATPWAGVAVAPGPGRGRAGRAGQGNCGQGNCGQDSAIVYRDTSHAAELAARQGIGATG